MVGGGGVVLEGMDRVLGDGRGVGVGIGEEGLKCVGYGGGKGLD